MRNILFSTIICVCVLITTLVQAQTKEKNINEFEKGAAKWTEVIKSSKDSKTLQSAYYGRGVCHFNLLQFKKSVADFDELAKLDKASEPHLWQRGISHYYAKMYKEGREQFEIHQKVNGHDVENAVWHFLCIAKQKGIKEAQKNLIPIEGDRRIPLMKAHALFAEKATVDDVLKRAKEELPEDKELAARKLNYQMFYAHLYIGLYYEAHEKPKLAYKHLQLAATKYFLNGYMGNVAKVHVQVYDNKNNNK